MTKRFHKVPNLRFPGFEGEWKEGNIGKLAEISSGGTPSRTTSTYWNGEIPWVTTSLINFNIVSEAEEYITEQGLKESSAKLFPKNTILMAMYGQGKTRGKVAILGMEAATNQACAAIIPNPSLISYSFLFQNLSKRYDEIRELSNQGGQQNLSGGIIKGIKILYPSFNEQIKIAELLLKIDSRIDTQNKIIEALKVQMLGLQEKLFRQKIKMKDENGNQFPQWEKRNGGELFSSISNKNHNSDLPILAITQDQGAVPRDSIDYQISVTDKSVESYKVVEIGDFIISLRSFQGGIEYSNYHGICSPAYIILKSKYEMNKLFYKYYFKTANYITLLNKKLEGIRDGKMISYTYFSEIELPYPTIEEQVKIATTLFSFEQKIEVEKQILKCYENQKQYLLQNLFI